jgi:hypothetical protein
VAGTGGVVTSNRIMNTGEGTRATEALTMESDGVEIDGHQSNIRSTETTKKVKKKKNRKSGSGKSRTNSTAAVRPPPQKRINNNDNGHADADADDDDDAPVQPPPQRKQMLSKPPCCCECTKWSTCKRPSTVNFVGCSCRDAGKPCTGCTCWGKCTNRAGPMNENTGRLRELFATQNAEAAAIALTGASTDPPTQPTHATMPPPRDTQEPTSTDDELDDEGTRYPELLRREDWDDDEQEGGGNQEDNRPPSPENIFPDIQEEQDPEAQPAIPQPVYIPIVTEEGADLAGYTSTPADRLLDSVYGDHAHANAGTRLDGGVQGDRDWQLLWKRMVQISPDRYFVPTKGPVGKRFLTIFAHELQEVRLNRTANSEKPMIFAATILQSVPTVTQAKDIKARLTTRMNMWQKGEYKALVDDTENAALSAIGSTRRTCDESRGRAYNKRVLTGRLRSAVRNLTNRGGGGALAPDQKCTKSERLVLDVLMDKHPEMREPPTVGGATGAFEDYDNTPTAMPVTITAETVEKVASRLSGAAGPSGTDAVELRNWLLRFGKESEALRQELAEWANWLANGHPPWAAYRALMACRLVALDKQPGVRPVGIGEIIRRLIAKCVLETVGKEATSACDNLNLCAGLASGIEGAVHAIKEACEVARHTEATEPTVVTPIHTQPAAVGDEDLGYQEFLTAASQEREQLPVCLLVDARNGFNELGRKAALWTVRHRWANGALFAFNCYRHAAQLILRRKGFPCYILLSKEGVTQGDPISMVIYGIALVPLAESLRAAVPTVVQPWYADDAAMAGPAEDVATAMRLLEEEGPARGYFPEPAKSILICDPPVLERAKIVLDEFDFQYKDGHRYVGGFIGTRASRLEWLEPQIQKWIDGIESLAKVAKRFPQTAYAGLVKSLQSEWQYLQRVTEDCADAFAPIEAAIVNTFLPALLGETKEGAALLRDLTALPVRQAGLGIPNPVDTAEQSHAASKASTASLTASLLSGQRLGAATYAVECAASSKAARKVRVRAEEAKAVAMQAQATPFAKRRMLRSKETGSWLTTMPDTLNGTELSLEEFRDNVRMRLGLVPANLPDRCEACNEKFTVEHAMDCKIGGLVLQRHNDVAAEWHHLCAQGLSPAAISDEPLIHTSQDVRDAGANGTLPPPDIRGDVGAHGFWSRGRTAIFDIRVTDTDAPSYRSKDLAKVLLKSEKEKKKMYEQLCKDRRKDFTPLVFSVDGMRARDAEAAIKRLAALLAKKWKRPYSELCGYVRSRLSVALARSASRCLRADRNPMVRRPTTNWDSGTGLRLYR